MNIRFFLFRWSLLGMGLAIALLTSTCMSDRKTEPAAYRAASRIALNWNRLVLELERYTPGYRPPVSARMFAYVEMAAYEAALPALEGYISLEKLCPGYHAPTQAAPAGYDLPTGLNAAYARTLRAFFPTAPRAILAKINALEAAHAEEQANSTNPEILSQSATFGRQIADAVWQFSTLDSVGHDGFLYNYDRQFTPCTEPGCWQPTGDHPLPALLPHWGATRTFLVKTNEIKVKLPTPFNESPGSAFYTEAMEVFSVSQTRAKEDNWIAEFWSDDLPGLTITPVGRWISIINQSLEKAQLPFPEIMETYLKSTWALCDAGVVCWQNKYRFQLQRPETFIRKNIQHDWTPLHAAPSFPSYPSGHATFGASVAEVLTAQLGEHFALTDRTHEDRAEFAGQPRSYTSFEEMAQENAFSRVLIGVHYRMDCEEGLRLGKIIGSKAAALPLRWDEASLEK